SSIHRKATRIAAMKPTETELSLASRGDDAKAVAVRINEDDEIVIWPILALIPRCTEAEQPLDLPLLVGRVEVEMYAAGLADRWQVMLGDAVERDVRA